MNYEKRVIVHGSGDTPKEGDEVAFSYRIYRYEKSKKDYKGDLLDENPSFTAKIGKDEIMEGLEKALLEMQIDEEVVLTLPNELAHSTRSGVVSAGYFKGSFSDELPLVFDLKLVSVMRITDYDS